MGFIVKLLKNNGKDDNGFFVGEKVMEFDSRKEFPFRNILLEYIIILVVVSSNIN